MLKRWLSDKGWRHWGTDQGQTMEDAATSPFMRCCHRTSRGKAWDACHVEFKWIHRVIWLLMLTPAAQLYSFFFFFSFRPVQRLITGISSNPRKQKLLLQSQLLCNHSTTCHFLGRKEEFFTWGPCDLPRMTSTWESGCHIFNNYHLCMELAVLRTKSDNQRQSDFFTLPTSLIYKELHKVPKD